MKTIHHVLDIDATPAVVWDALTARDSMAGWWSTQVDAPGSEIGSLVRWTFAGDFNPVMEVAECTPETALSWRCVAGHDKWAGSEFEFRLVALDDGRTRLRFWQHYAAELSDDDYGIYNFNWGYYLESLRLLCATGTGKPFNPPAH